MRSFFGDPRVTARGLFAIAAVALCVGCAKDPAVAKQEYLSSGNSYAANAKWAEAIIEYRKAINEDARFGEARLKLGMAYEQVRDYQNALREYIRAADLMPDDLTAQVSAGKALLLSRQYPEARARAQQVLSKDPKNIDGLMLLGNALAGLKDFPSAVTEIEEAIDKDPQRTLLYANLGLLKMATGDRAAAESAFKRAVEVDPSVDSFAGLANFYWAEGRLDEAQAEFKHALEKAPTNPGLLQAVAAFYQGRGQLNDAEQYLQRYAAASKDGGARLTLADFYLRTGKRAAAEPLLKGLVDAGPPWAHDATLRLAALDYESGKRAEAHAAIDGILSADAGSETARLSKARFLIREGKYRDALTQTRGVVEANKQSVAGFYLNGVSQQAIGEASAAIDSFREVLKLNPTLFLAAIALSDLYLTQGDAAAALEFAGQAVKIDARVGASHVALAKALVANGQYPAAEAEIALLARNGVKVSVVEQVRGDLAWRRGDRVQARAAYGRALAADSESFPALRGLIEVDLADKRVASARERVEAILAKGTADPDFHVLAGMTYVAAGDVAKAETALKKALELDPANLEGYGRLATLYMMTNRLDAAKSEFERMTSGNVSQAVSAYTMLGTILTAQGQRDEAKKHYQKAMELDNEAPVASNNLAWNIAQTGTGADLDVALKLAQTAKGKLPKSWEVSDTLGWVYYKKGLASLAVGALREGTQLNPNEPTLHYHLGLALQKNGDIDAAKKSLQQALKLNPSFPDAADAKRALTELGG